MSVCFHFALIVPVVHLQPVLSVYLLTSFIMGSVYLLALRDIMPIINQYVYSVYRIVKFVPMALFVKSVNQHTLLASAFLKQLLLMDK